MTRLRKIIHVDMDAFYASVEQRDDPSLRGKPVVVACGARSVVCAASYEARVFGVRSAMPAVRAERLCPDAIFVPPDFARYKAVSQQVRAIFLRHTDLVEPLSLDEAYLDVTEPKSGIELATDIARTIRAQIREETHLTASAGIAPNKFLAKIASDWRKPDGQFVIPPQRVDAFLLPLPVKRVPGVGKVMEGKLAARGIVTCGDLRQWALTDLEEAFGSFGRSLYNRARGIDERPVEPEAGAVDFLGGHLRRRPAAGRPDRGNRAVGGEDLEGHPQDRACRPYRGAEAEDRAVPHPHPQLHPGAPAGIDGRTARHRAGPARRVDLPAETRYRLVGVGLGGFREKEAVVQGNCSSTDRTSPHPSDRQRRGQSPLRSNGIRQDCRYLSKRGGSGCGA